MSRLTSSLPSQYPFGSNNIISQSYATWMSSCYCPVEFASGEPMSTRVSADQPDASTTDHTFSGSVGLDLSPEAMQPNEDSTWQVVGEDLLVVLTEQDSERLISLFPGASYFSFDNGTNCVFRGVCGRCSRQLSQGSTFLDCYDARLYCANCHQLQEAIIPRAVLHNWNFSLQPVSQPTKSFLLGLHRRPIINVAKLNPTLYAVIPELFVVRQLRRMIVFLWHQINRCDAATAMDLLNTFRPFDFMFTSLHDLDLYSMQDLCNVRSGRLEQQLLHAINNIALAHVHSCTACRSRALICSYCDNPQKPIWPHEFTTYKWCATPGCPEAIHVKCLAAEHDDPNSNQMSSIICPVRRLSSTNLTPVESWKPRCSVCAVHSHNLGTRKIGHYADPFLLTTCLLVNENQ